MQALHTLSHATFRLQYHIVFVMKYRHKALTAEMLARLESLFGDILRQWRCTLVEFGGEADHIHLLVDAHPSLNLAELVGNLKSVSARKMRQEFASELKPYYWKPYFWSRSYAALSVASGANLETLIAYLQNQETPKE